MSGLLHEEQGEDEHYMRTAEQIADEMAEEMRRRFGFKATGLVRLWLARCIMGARYEQAHEMARNERE